jgi:hypothetical protein
MKNIAQKFEAEVAKAVSLILAASHAVAVEALDEAFAIADKSDGQGSTGTRRMSVAPRRPSSPRRSGAEIAALEQRFLEAVWAMPGEPMSVLASRVDASPSALQVPVARLKAAGRLKTVGSRQFTRYFPIERGEEAGVGTAA